MPSHMLRALRFASPQLSSTRPKLNANTRRLSAISMSPADLKYVSLAASSAHTATLILLHGLGDSGDGLAPVGKMLKSATSLSHLKVILPHSPHLPVTLNGGMVMPSWFDLESLELDGREDEKGLLLAAHSVKALIAKEIEAGIPANRIVLGGFSQGGAVSLLTGLTLDTKLAGMVVLSSWLPLSKKILDLISPTAKEIPVWWGHGKADPVVQYKFGADSVKFLTSQAGFPISTSSDSCSGVSFNSYDGLGHSLDPQEINQLQKWLQLAVPKDV